MGSKIVQILPAPGWSVRLRTNDRGWNPRNELAVEHTVRLICWAVVERPESRERRITALIIEPVTGRLVQVDEWLARSSMVFAGWVDENVEAGEVRRSA